MGVSKVDYGGRTLIDLTGDTVTPDKVLTGVTFHGANGEAAVGSMSAGVTVRRASGTFTTNNNSAATINCGFQPDLLLVQFEPYYDSVLGRNTTPTIVMSFAEIAEAQASATVLLENALAACLATRTSTGATIDRIYQFEWSWAETAYPNRTFNYIAVKYT